MASGKYEFKQAGFCAKCGCVYHNGYMPVHSLCSECEWKTQRGIPGYEDCPGFDSDRINDKLKRIKAK